MRVFLIAGIRLVVLTALAVGSLLLAVDLPSGDGPIGFVRNAAFAAAGLFAFVALGVLLHERAKVRMSAMRARHADSLVLMAMATPLSDDLTVLVPGKGRAMPPFILLVASPDGLGFWGTGGYPGHIVSLEWAQITTVEPAMIRTPGRPSRGLTIHLASSALSEIRCVLVGAGLTGAGGLSQSKLEEAARELEALRSRSRALP